MNVPGVTVPPHRIASIALIGLSGVGKSTIARLLAGHLGYSWIDTDTLIVQQAGCPIATLFATYGEDYFRSLETAVLRDTLTTVSPQPHIIATGGGIILREENRALLQRHSYIVWLDAPTEVLLARLLADDEERPLVAGNDPAGRIEAMRTARSPLYRALAHQVIDTAALTPAAAAEQIATAYRHWQSPGTM